MTATGYTSSGPGGDVRKVSKSGDAMTGDLVLADSSPDTALSAASRAFVEAAVASAGSGPSPSGTVTAETSYGQTANAGAATAYARGDHTHGTPAAPAAGTTAGTFAAGDDARITGAVQKATVTAKGDLLAATGNAAVSRLPVGSDGQILVADSTASGGVGWKPTAYPPSYRLPRWAQPSVVLTNFQPSHGFTASGGTFTANDTTDFVRGVQAAKLVTPGDSTTYFVSGTVSSADSTGKMPRITVKVDDITKLANLQVDLCTDTSWANGWTWVPQTGATGSNYLTSGDWITQTLSFHDATKIGAGARSGLTAIRFRIADNGASATVHLQGVELVPDGTQAFPNGVVSITFDDSWQDALDYGKTALDKYGYNATTFVIADRIGLSGRLTMAELMALQNQGWELSSHAYLDSVHTSSFTGVTAAQLDADARAMKDFAVRNGFRAADLIAYPKGQYGLTSDGVSTSSILDNYFSAGITTIQKTKETYPPSDAWRLRRISAISTFSGGYSPTLLTQSNGDFDQCKANGSWLILAFHEIVSGAAATTGQISQADFTTIIDTINSKGIPVVPVGEVLRYASTTATATATVDSSSIPKKAGTVGSPGAGTLASPWDHVHPRTWWAPEDHGFLTWTFEPQMCASSGNQPTAGVLQLARVHVPAATTITNIVLFAQTAGSTLTSGQNFAALYTSGGSLLAATADQSTAWASTGTKTMALTSAQSVAAGDYYVGFYANGTTAPAFSRAAGAFSIVNTGLSNANSRWATAATGLTTAMPASAGTVSSSSNSWWAALS